MNTTKELIKSIGINRLINFKEANQDKGRFCEYYGKDHRRPYHKELEFRKRYNPEEALIYSLYLLIKQAEILTFSSGEHYCNDCKGYHYNNGSFLSIQNEFKLIKKDDLRNKLNKLF